METRFILLSRGQVATVDASDYDWLNQWKWSAWWCEKTKSFYAVRTETKPDKSRHMIYMHRLILGLEKGDKSRGDHCDLNTLRNIRSNLRVSTASQNNCNTGARSNNKSGFKGVSLDKESGRWLANISFSGKRKTLGRFSTPEEAHGAYCAAAAELHGEFAYNRSFQR